jgi:hypothetical protein
MKRVDTSILYLTVKDLIIEAKNKNIEDINLNDINYKFATISENVVILKKDSKYKVLKSRY